MYVCLCKGITDSQIKQAVENGADSVREVNMQLGTGSQCGKCKSAAKNIIQHELATNRPMSGVVEFRP